MPGSNTLKTAAAILAVALSLASGPSHARPSGLVKQAGAARPDAFCNANSARIMFLGTYHFANPGLDAKNVNADDVLTPHRQAQIESLTQKLAGFSPTKIMVEAPFGDRSVQRTYERYRAGTYALQHNETEQIGFRLAKKLNLASIYPIDFPMRMSGLRPDEVDDNWRPKAAPPPVTASPPAPASSAAGELSAEDRLLRASTMTEIFVRMNDPSKVEAGHSESYMELLRPEDSAAVYAKSDYFANWYKRNIRMFANIARYTDFPRDNVLVIVGSGHLKILRDLARDAPYFCLVEPNSFLGGSSPKPRRP